MVHDLDERKRARMENGQAEAKYTPKWVPTANERNFTVALEVLEKGAGEGRFCVVSGDAGRGKTRTTHRYASHNNCVHLLMRSTWKTSELGLLQALCRELGVLRPPARKDAAFIEVADRLIADQRPVFLDEMEKLPQHLNLVRELSEITACPFILIGEPEIETVMQRNKRVWSRTFQRVKFDPVSGSDIILYGKETSGLEIAPEAAGVINKAPGGGDWRVVKRTIIDLVEIANMNRTRTVNRDMAKTAIKMGLNGSSGR